MKLGLSRNEVRLVEYDKSWNKEFNRTKESILLNSNFSEKEIQHIGSTSIDGMAAKPIIDILLGVENLDKVSEDSYKKLEEIGFFRLKIQLEEEIVLAKFLDDIYKVKTHYIHLVQKNSPKWEELLFFRNYLRENQWAKQKYQSIKMEGVKEYKTDIKAYTEYKESFVQSILERSSK